MHVEGQLKAYQVTILETGQKIYNLIPGAASDPFCGSGTTFWSLTSFDQKQAPFSCPSAGSNSEAFLQLSNPA